MRANLRSQQALKALVKQCWSGQLLTVCHRIGNGEAFKTRRKYVSLIPLGNYVL